MPSPQQQLKKIMADYELSLSTTANLLGVSEAYVQDYLAPAKERKYKMLNRAMLALLERRAQSTQHKVSDAAKK